MTASTRTLSAAALVLALGSALSMTTVPTVHAADDTTRVFPDGCH
ncbi:hypothetical protein EDB98_10536 [Pseudomonas fluorescens]|nr:hypothetical protein EDB98_10536 [Pseudomonas fluorescens]SFW72435.1 hypothetical protein SAMN03159439_04057 [Pseudomonas sp. NFACC04-2]